MLEIYLHYQKELVMNYQSKRQKKSIKN